jgi:hypothetical protein
MGRDHGGCPLAHAVVDPDKLVPMAVPMLVPIRLDARARWRARRSTIFTVLLAVALSALVGIAMVKLGTVQRELKAVLIIVAGIAMVTAALRPRIGLTMLLVLMPFEYGFSGTGTDEVLIVSMALVLAWRIQWRAIPSWASVGGGALVLGSFVAAIGAHDQTAALWGAARWLGVILIMFAAFTVLRDRREASRRMIDIFTGSAVIVVAFAFAQKVGIYVLVGAPYYSEKPDSFFGYYTNYAGYVAMAATLATGELLVALGERRRLRAAIYGVAVVLMLVGIAISTSRGGLLALGGGWFMLLALNVRRGSVLVQGAVILVVFALAAYVVTPRSTVHVIQERLTLTISHSAGASDQTRFALQAAGERALERDPFGIGYNNFAGYLRGNIRNVNIRRTFFHAASTPVQIGLDAGWLGLAGFLMLWVWPIGLVIVRGAGGFSAVRASAFAAALGGLMAQGLFDYLFYEIAFLAFFAALVWGTWHALSTDTLGVRISSRAGGVQNAHRPSTIISAR